MAQIFHPSTNTISKVSIFGTIFIIAALAWAGAEFYTSDYVTGVMNTPRILTREFPQQIISLVERFFDETPLETIQRAVAEGPSALSGLCFRWAADAVRTAGAEQVFKSAHADSPPSLAYMEAVRTLSAAIKETVRRVFGDPVPPAIPGPPPGFECVRIGMRESLQIQVPEKRPRGAQYLGGVEWAWGPWL